MNNAKKKMCVAPVTDWRRASSVRKLSAVAAGRNWAVSASRYHSHDSLHPISHSPHFHTGYLNRKIALLCLLAYSLLHTHTAALLPA